MRVPAWCLFVRREIEPIFHMDQASFDSLLFVSSVYKTIYTYEKGIDNGPKDIND
ncbi:hypothetical protein TOL_0487 [Thalassolituus oleivorans MIL-1]|uniref:Uncharacterized protein n=1 Tax=Thalassolituus oleivorans MIL-1 TaxID=1298593 RepID=M5DNB0_9GAMM|nr:hypothetical protein TOL_0487 [Thalassolituus oleivorans MIL-1]